MAVSEKMKKRMRQKQEELRSRGGSDGIIYLKEGTLRVRVLSAGEDEEFVREVSQVYLGPKIRGVISPTSIGKPCAINEKFLKLKSSKKDSDKEDAKAFVPKKRYLMAVAVYKDQLGKEIDTDKSGKLVMITKGLYDAIIDHYLDDEWGDMTDPINGYDIKLKRVGSGQMDTEYSVIPCKASRAPKGFNKPVDLDKMIKAIIPSYETTEAKLDEFLNGADAADSEDEDDDLGARRPIPRKKKVLVKKKLGMKKKSKK